MPTQKLSIIIPCYNCQETLGQAVASIYDQGLTDFEVVMVDDGSTDGTRSEMEQLTQKYPGIKIFFHDKNRGGGATRNTAVSKTTGDIIFCLDSDDILPANTLPKMVNFLTEKNCDGITIHRSIKFIGNNINDIQYIDVAPRLGEKIEITSLLSKDQVFIPLYVNFMYTRKAFDQAGGYPTRHGFDTQGFAWRFVCAGLNAYPCPEAEYLHRVKYNESYYLREYNDGKMNYNWRDILLEHYYVFNDRTLNFIQTFDCSDFTRSIVAELIDLGDILAPNFRENFGKVYPPLKITLPETVYVKRGSFKGYFLRIKHRLKNFLKRNR